MLKIALLGNEIPAAFPGLLADMLFAHDIPVKVYIYEDNPEMGSLLKQYGDAVNLSKKIELCLADSIQEALEGADGVVYAHQAKASSAFDMDREILSEVGLSDQARPYGGIEGLLHTLRTGDKVINLCEIMQEKCPKAKIITMAKPLGRIILLFNQMGFEAIGIDESQSPEYGPEGVRAFYSLLSESLPHSMSHEDAIEYLKEAKVEALRDELYIKYGGMWGFNWLCDIKADLREPLTEKIKKDGLGELAKQWLDWYGAIPFGNVLNNAQYMPAQPGYTPEEKPVFIELIAQRKERVLNMQKVIQKGLTSQEGNLAQIALLSIVGNKRPVQALYGMLLQANIKIEGVCINNNIIKNVPKKCAVQTNINIQEGKVLGENSLALPTAISDMCIEMALCDQLAVRASFGDHSAVRDVIENDIALGGLDRLYCLEITDKLIKANQDMLPRFF